MDSGWCRQLFRRGTALVEDEAAHRRTHIIVRAVGVCLVINAFRGVSFSSACVILNQLAASSVLPIQSRIRCPLRESLAGGDISRLLAVVQTHVSAILEDGEVVLGQHTRASDGISQGVILGRDLTA